MSETEATLGRQINIRMSKKDVEILEGLMKKKGWDRSKAARYMIRMYGKILMSGRVEEFEEILTEIPEIPENCPKCGSELILRAPLKKAPDEHKEDAYDEVIECNKCHTLYRAIYTPIAFIELKES